MLALSVVEGRVVQYRAESRYKHGPELFFVTCKKSFRMPYNKEELLKLSVEEKPQLMEDLIASVNEEEMDNDEELITIAKERYEQYLKNPDEGISWDEFRKKIYEKYGFVDNKK